MTLIKSISGIRGTIHENDDSGLCTKEIKICINRFIGWVIENHNNQKKRITIVVGRDGRISGQKITSLISNILVGSSIDVINLGLTTTPSVQMAVISENCLAGIMVSASHNPSNWNGLKFLNSNGEFLSKKEGLEVFNFKKNNKNNLQEFTGSIYDFDYKEKHVSSVLNLIDVNVQKIKLKKFKIVVDGINSSGGVYVPFLLRKLGVDVVELNCNPNGQFEHDPEPLPKNLQNLSNKVKKHKADLGIAVDPDVDRLVLVCEDGSFFGEEYTIVAIAKYILSKYPENTTVSNLSTTKALSDIAKGLGSTHFESKVGEINVVELMKEKKSIIGGEGSGGVIFPASHYGRDALVGIGLFLTYLSESNLSVKELRKRLPSYFMIKEKIAIVESKGFTFDQYIRDQIKYLEKSNNRFSLIDGLKVYYCCGSWSHVRNSNTEPVIRLIVEAHSEERANEIKIELMESINKLIK